MAEPPLPVVYLPGASGRSAVWRPIAERLARRRSPIFIDYPGLGDAPLDSSIRSLDDLSRVVSASLPPRADVVSLSMGSAVALRLALHYPERVRRLVLVTPAGGTDALLFGATDWRPSFRARRPDAPRWFVDDARDLAGELGRVTARTLLVAGEHDSIAPIAFANHLRTRLPFATLELVPAATHDLEDEFPDLVASLIEAHFRRTDDT